MKAFLSLTALMLTLGFTTVQAATTVFMIGIDHEPNATSEFEQEGNPRTDQKYYWENGDYSSVIGRTGAGVNWTSGMEPWKDESSVLGFSRAVTSGTHTHDIFFQITPAMIQAGNRFLLEIEYYGAGQATGQPASSHDIDYYLNGVKVGNVVGLAATNLPNLFSLEFDASQFDAGASVLSWTRTGGVPGYVNMDFVRLSVVPEPSLSVLTAGGLALLALRRRRLA